MRIFFKMVTLFISLLVLFFDINVFAISYDLFIEDVFLSYDEIEEVYDKHLEKINEFESNLVCSSLDSNTVVEKVTEELGDQQFETFSEKESYINDLKNNGYSVNEKILLEDSVLSTYSFVIVNGNVASTKVNNVDSSEYNGFDYDLVLSLFEDIDNNDEKVLVKIMGDTPVVNEGMIIFDTLEEAKVEVIRLDELGYDAYYQINDNNKYIVYYSYEVNEYTIFVEEFDKDYIVSASKTDYLVRTIGMIVKDEICGERDELEEIIPPHTYVEEAFSYNIVLFYEERKKINK